MPTQYNLRSPAVKRLMREAEELSEPTEQYFTQPLEDNLFEWHFTIRGPVDTDFDGGVYHGRIILPPDYPMKPPSIILLTPNGRFETNTKICLSISKHHPESWQPSWSIRTALLAIIGFMPSPGQGAIGSLDYTPVERQALAKRSLSYTCDHCGVAAENLLPVTEKSKEAEEEIRNLASQLSMQGEKKDNGTATQEAQEIMTAAADTVGSENRNESAHENTTSVSTTSSAPPTVNFSAPAEPRRRRPDPVEFNASSIPSTQSSNPRSRSCIDGMTYYAMIVIAIVLGILILRRLLNSQMLRLFIKDDAE